MNDGFAWNCHVKSKNEHGKQHSVNWEPYRMLIWREWVMSD